MQYPDPSLQQPTFSIGVFTPLPPKTFITACETSSKFVLLGLSDGTLCLYDVFGNLLDRHENLHIGPIASVALGAGTSANEVIASVGRARHDIRVARLFAGAAETVSTSTSPALNKMLTSASLCFTKQADREIVKLAVDPNFGKPRFGERVAFVEDEGRVVIFASGWFGGSEVVVAEGRGVTDLRWISYLLAYACTEGVKVWDTRANRAVCVVAPPGNTAPSSPVPSPQATVEKFREASEGNDEQAEHEKESTRMEKGERREEERNKVREKLVQDLLSTKDDNPWAMKTKIYMEVDEEVSLSPYGEPTVSLFITWPTGARTVQIGPLKGGPSAEQAPQRDIEVVFKLERPSIIVRSMNANSRSDSDDNGLAENVAPVEETPLLGLVPFGEKGSVALVGTPSNGLTIHLISAETGESEKSMLMPQSSLCDADLLIVPGGDPLVLIVAHQIGAGTYKLPRDHRNGPQDGQELIYVRSLTTAERVKWLLGQGRFSDALHIAQTAPGGSLRRAEVSVEDIGEQFLESLRESGEFGRLVSLLSETITATTPYLGQRAREKVMAKRVKRWERWIQTFRQVNKLPLLAPVVPTYEPRLPKHIYNSILVELADDDPKVMLNVLKTWPADVFEVSTITKAIEEQMDLTSNEPENNHKKREPLSDGLLMMYGLSGRHDETLNLLLREQSPKVYDYIRSHHLYEAVRSAETITGLFKIDSYAAIDLLAHAPETVLPPDAIVPILVKVNNSLWTFMYLHAVFRIDVDQAPKYHNQLLKLYIEHGSPGMLLSFLRTSTHYSLDRALREMGGPKGFKKGELADERVYVLSAMGDLSSAMDSLLDEQGDTFAAIEFASDHGDTALWERLIEHARTHADTLAVLLDSPAGGKVDPVRLVPLLTSEMRIAHLRDRLHRILVDAALERALREDAAAALHHDASELLDNLDDCVST